MRRVSLDVALAAGGRSIPLDSFLGSLPCMNHDVSMLLLSEQLPVEDQWTEQMAEACSACYASSELSCIQCQDEHGPVQA